MSTTPSMTIPSIEEGTAHNPVFLSEVPNTPVTLQSTHIPGRTGGQTDFGNENQNLPDYVIETLSNDFCAQFCNLFFKFS